MRIARRLNRSLIAISISVFLTLSPVTLYAAIDSNDQTASSKKTITIGVIGDSLSAGYGLKADEGWVVLLSQKLNQQNINADVINVSISGATTDAGLQMQASLLPLKPDIVILELGANDGLQGKPLALIYNNLATLIQQASSAGAEVLLLGIKLPPNLGARYTEPFFTQYKTLAAQFNVALIPFFLEGVAGNPALMQADGLHPNQTAQAKILNTIWPTLTQMINDIETDI